VPSRSVFAGDGGLRLLASLECDGRLRSPASECDSSSTCKLGTLFVSVKYVLVSVKLVCVYVKLLKT
jgi:hypothetical protein